MYIYNENKFQKHSFNLAFLVSKPLAPNRDRIGRKEGHRNVQGKLFNRNHQNVY